MTKQVLTDEQIEQQRALFEAASLQASLDELRALARAFDRMGLRGSAMALRDRAVNLEAWSDHADQARHRITRKELKRREEDGKLSPSPTMP